MRHRLCLKIRIVPILIFATHFVSTVYAVTRLYASLGVPTPELIIVRLDPCGLPSWEGLECENGNIIGITLSGANLGGKLDDDLGFFNSIRLLDLSNNHIGGSIPTDLPITLRTFNLSGNQLVGTIPDTLSSLSELTNFSLSDNHLTGPIPDVFQQLDGLVNLDVSGNGLTNELPYSMGNLSSLTTLHLQNNQLSGTLDVLQNLHLRDLNVENNMFSGTIPEKLLTIPNFRRDGNPFDTTILPSPPASPPSSYSDVLSPPSAPGTKADGPSASQLLGSRRKEKKSGITWIGIAGLLVTAILASVLCLFMSRRCRRRLSEKNSNRRSTGMGNVLMGTHTQEKSLRKPLNEVQKVAKEVVSHPIVEDTLRNDVVMKQGMDHNTSTTRLDEKGLSLEAPPMASIPSERIVADPIITHLTPRENASEIIDFSKLFTVASLQQYTTSFAPESLIGEGTLGSVYRAQLPDGKVLVVKKLDKAATGRLNDRQFLELVSSISKLHHANIVELVGYCLEHGQRLLVYNYCSDGMLNEALSLDDEINKKLSWNARMHLALQAAKALEYLHEVCQPPIVHGNFTSANVLLDDDLSIRVSDCGLAPLLPSNFFTQLQGSGYGAPELELGNYSWQSDVYSFGVVMLELLSGRKANDKSRPRGEQYLVRWAFSQLHDIDALSRMVDPSLAGAYLTKSLSRLADIVSLCIQPQPEFRPPMSEIVQKLLHMIQRDL
ncbi:protein STRUBBELIG-RECEPTOR FAMILY 3-like isoform X2 [Henckelia pumila]|uniref:protein STRUBBELIG-RECEPTOR FAMILY 3-like isoform X2 n=1 Tax=Henckelia pumila TaxID=405737 RepID=UPI003C6E44C0